MAAETKAGIRRVRTAGGVRRFDQALGSIIVPDAPIVAAVQAITRSVRDVDADSSKKPSRQSGVLKKVPTDYEGWDKYEDGPEIRYVGKDEEGWAVLDDEDVDMTGYSYPNKREAVADMHETYASEFPDKGNFAYTRNSKKPAINMPRQETLDASHLQLASSEREIIEHMKKWGYSIPLDAEWVYLNQDPDSDSENYAYFYTRNAAGRANGKWQPRQIPKRAQVNAGNKFARVNKLRQDVKKIDAKLTAALVTKDDTWAAIAMMRVLGMRVGTRDGDPNNIGTMQLQKKHVTFRGDVAMIRYTAKKGTAVEYETDDPIIVAALKARTKTGTQESFLFKNTDDAKAIATQRSVTGGDYQNHDFRRLLATERAAEQVALFNRRKKAPKTQAEFNDVIKEIDNYVNFDILKEKTKGVALKSYIDPRTFEQWRKSVAGK